MLLVTLEIGQQAATLIQFGGAGQFFQALRQLLLALGQGTGLATGVLDHAELLLVAGLQATNLPEAPAAHGDSGGTHQQGERGQAIAS
ncbi:hypothetical protein D9M71_116360 [compost metagenome]